MHECMHGCMDARVYGCMDRCMNVCVGIVAQIDINSHYTAYFILSFWSILFFDGNTLNFVFFMTSCLQHRA